MGKAPIVLNNLIDIGAIPPIVAVFIPPVDREREYNCDDRYVSFLCDELLPVLQFVPGQATGDRVPSAAIANTLTPAAPSGR